MLQPDPRPASGSFSRCRSGRSSASGSPFHARAVLRATTWTAAPLSCSSAADSSADWPAPMTATVRPRNPARSVCAELCVHTEAGSPDSGAGTYAKCSTPTATTTRRASTRSRLARVSSKCPSCAAMLGDQHFFDVEAEPVLEPLSIADEGAQRHGQTVARVRQALLPAESLQRVAAGGIGEVGRETLRLQEHPLRHGRLPQPHGHAEVAEVKARFAQVRGQ